MRVGSATGVTDPLAASTLNELDNARLDARRPAARRRRAVGLRLGRHAANSGALTRDADHGPRDDARDRLHAASRTSRSSSAQGADAFFVDSTPAGSALLLNGGDEAPVVNDFNDVINIRSIAGPAVIEGGGGNDVIRVNFDENGSQTFNNGIAGVLTLRGQADGDLYEIGLSGAPNPLANLTLINVDDQGPAPPADPGRNVLRIYGTDDADTFLFRARHAEDTIDPSDVSSAMIAAFEVDEDGNAVPGGFIERINYDGQINGGVQVFGRKGDDTFVLDDNLAGLVLFGDEGNDTFQVGQVFQSARDGSNPDNGLDPMDYFQTTLTTRGWLSNGISRSATLFGGTGNDNFTVYRNLAELFLFGEEDDDTFLIRAFVRVNPNDPQAPFTNVNGGQGADFISYTVNAPVRIDGGDGLDTLTVVGTEFGDDFVVTDQGVFGAGLFITYAGIEKLVVDAQEGNDRFFVASTSESVALEILGGLGSDVFNIGGGNDGQAITVVSNSLRGHNGLIEQLLAGNDPDLAGVFAQDLVGPGRRQRRGRRRRAPDRRRAARLREPGRAGEPRRRDVRGRPDARADGERALHRRAGARPRARAPRRRRAGSSSTAPTAASRCSSTATTGSGRSSSPSPRPTTSSPRARASSTSSTRSSRARAPTTAAPTTASPCPASSSRSSTTTRPTSRSCRSADPTTPPTPRRSSPRTPRATCPASTATPCCCPSGRPAT